MILRTAQAASSVQDGACQSYPGMVGHRETLLELLRSATLRLIHAVISGQSELRVTRLGVVIRPPYELFTQQDLQSIYFSCLHKCQRRSPLLCHSAKTSNAADAIPPIGVSNVESRNRVSPKYRSHWPGLSTMPQWCNYASGSPRRQERRAIRSVLDEHSGRVHGEMSAVLVIGWICDSKR